VSALLAAERTATLEQVERLEQEFAGIVEAVGLAGADDEHDPEGATIAFERQHVAALASQARGHLAQIEAALRRLTPRQLQHLRGLCPADSCRTPGRPASEHHLPALCHSPVKQPQATLAAAIEDVPRPAVGPLPVTSWRCPAGASRLGKTL
jgi:hypothetical protein